MSQHTNNNNNIQSAHYSEDYSQVSSTPTTPTTTTTTTTPTTTTLASNQVSGNGSGGGTVVYMNSPSSSIIQHSTHHDVISDYYNDYGNTVTADTGDCVSYTNNNNNDYDKNEILNWGINKCKGTCESMKFGDLKSSVIDKKNRIREQERIAAMGRFGVLRRIFGGKNSNEETLPLNNENGGEEAALKKAKPHKLSQLPATAISGNDLLSSCLYVTGLCTSYAGFFAPLCLLLVDLLLYLYKSIYSEVGSAIALNGASYTLLLNTTSKRTASLAACLTVCTLSVVVYICLSV